MMNGRPVVILLVRSCERSCTAVPFVVGAPRRASPEAAAGGENSQTKRREGTVAVKLRLMRMGKKKQPTYRIVAADSRAPRDGRFIEIVGTYDPPRAPPHTTV